MIYKSLLKYDGLAGQCLVACTADGQSAQLLLRPYSKSDTELLPGQGTAAVVRSVAHDQGGYFLEAASGQPLFLSITDSRDLLEGQRCEVVCVASARFGKSARVRIAPEGKDLTSSAVSAWIAQLFGESIPEPHDDSESHLQIDQFIDELSANSVTLQNGGRITIEQTRALTAVDVDTVGRADRTGSRAERAHRINLDATAELARQIALRDLGGTIVLDCLSPISKARGKALQTVFLAAFKALSNRRVRALRPSDFGLIEIAVAWGMAPFHDRFLDEFGRPNGHLQLWQALRQLESEAMIRTGDQLVLELTSDTIALFDAKRSDYMQRIQSRFGGRIEVEPSRTGKTEVRSI
ncbi:MAG: ribonuclease E/G [Pseudomonadota bacterium]